VVVTLGTSGCAFGLSDVPTADASGLVAGYADATGRFLPLVCTLNAARVLSTVADLLGRSLTELDALALAAPPGAGGLTLLPYLDGERTPNLPDARGLLAGLTRDNASAANLARAAVEGMLGGLVDALDALRAQDIPVNRVLLGSRRDPAGPRAVRRRPATGAGLADRHVVVRDATPPDGVAGHPARLRGRFR
jgi:xylulokinase